jgi:hypothetical protein
MDLINATHAGDTEKTKCLATDSFLITKADAQGNSPLHYAVARHDLKLIRKLIEEGASISAKNHQGETAAGWFELFFTSIYSVKSDTFKALERAIKCNNSRFVAELLVKGGARDLRFSQAKTILHWALDYQKMDVVKVILEGCDRLAVERLLHLKDSQGVTPLALAQQHCQLGSPMAQEIVNYLQAKRRIVVEEGIVLAFQLEWRHSSLFKRLSVEPNERQALEELFSPSDFAQLKPLRSTIVRLAYNICCQAELYIFNTHSSCNNGPESLMKRLFDQLFGRWTDSSQRIFRKKFLAASIYLYNLIIKKQVDQVIEFSEEKSCLEGRATPGLKKIYLNPWMKNSVISMVATLIHEVTHQSGHSYDFFPAVYSDSTNGLSISLVGAYQLSAKGIAGELTPEKRRLFEVRQLLETGKVLGWEKELHHWMALNSAETLTIAILALATLPTGFAKLKNKPEPNLLIKPQFLHSLCGVAAPAKLPAPVRALGFSFLNKKRSRVNSSRCFGEAVMRGSAGSETSTNVESPSVHAQASPSLLIENMAKGSAAPDLRAPSPESLQANQPSPSTSLAFPDSQKPLESCHIS